MASTMDQSIDERLMDIGNREELINNCPLIFTIGSASWSISKVDSALDSRKDSSEGRNRFQ